MYLPPDPCHISKEIILAEIVTYGLCQVDEVNGAGRIWLVKPSALATVISQLGLQGRPIIIDKADDMLVNSYRRDFEAGKFYVQISGP